MFTGRILTIADIQTRDILFYDPNLKDPCYEFCEKRDIDYLPALYNALKIYERDKESKNFIERDVGKKYSINGTKNAFGKNILNIFREQPLRLVFENDELTGVVHFSDYGKPVVSHYLYGLFFEYEKQLRHMLIQQGLNDSDMIAYFVKKKKNNNDIYDQKLQDYQRRIEKEKYPPFELFQFKDLIALANHNKRIKLNDIGDLRNMIMHARELVSKEDPIADDYVYRFDSFKGFFDLAIKLHDDYKRVANRNAFLEDRLHPRDHRP